MEMLQGEGNFINYLFSHLSYVHLVDVSIKLKLDMYRRFSICYRVVVGLVIPSKKTIEKWRLWVTFISMFWRDNISNKFFNFSISWKRFCNKRGGPIMTTPWAELPYFILCMYSLVSLLSNIYQFPAIHSLHLKIMLQII